MSIRPSQNPGIAWPRAVAAIPKWSTTVPRRAAERTPTGTATRATSAEDDAQRGGAVAQGRPEVAVGSPAQELGVLHPQGAIKPEQVAEVGDVLGLDVEGQEEDDRVAGDPDHEEHGGQGQEDRPDRLAGPPGHVPQHDRALSSPLPGRGLPHPDL